MIKLAALSADVDRSMISCCSRSNQGQGTVYGCDQRSTRGQHSGSSSRAAPMVRSVC
jgi:hypothetical protein